MRRYYRRAFLNYQHLHEASPFPEHLSPLEEKIIENYQHILPRNPESDERDTLLVASGTAANQVVADYLAQYFPMAKGVISKGWYYEHTLDEGYITEPDWDEPDTLITNFLVPYGFDAGHFYGLDEFEDNIAVIVERIRKSDIPEVVVLDITVNPQFNFYDYIPEDVRDNVTLIKTASLTKNQKNGRGFYGIVDIDNASRVGIQVSDFYNVVDQMNAHPSESALFQFPIVTKAELDEYREHRKANIAAILDECKRLGIANRVVVPEEDAPYIILPGSDQNLWDTNDTVPYYDTFGLSFTSYSKFKENGLVRISVGYHEDINGAKDVTKVIARGYHVFT